MAKPDKLQKRSYFQHERTRAIYFLSIFFLVTSCQRQNVDEADYFKIRVVDGETGRGVPMVGLIPLSRQKYYTDSNGLIAFNEPGLMGERVYFEINSEGYTYPMGSDGRRAVTLHCNPGDSAVIEMVRTNVAERLYRITGLGIYRDSYLLGEPTPIENPLLNAKVVGQDSNLATIYNGQLFWIWGDTFLPPEYHGNFSVSAATSDFPSNGGLNPEIGVNYEYFTNKNGASRPMIDLKSPGYVWFDWIMNIKNSEGQERLVAKYANVNAYFGNYERGIAVYNDEKKIFESTKQVDKWMSYGHRCEHPFKGESNGQEYFYLTAEFDFQRVSPQLDSLSTPSAYESFTCLKPGTKFKLGNLQLDRDSNGKLNYAWKKNTDFVDLNRQNQLVKAGKIKSSEAWIQLLDIETGKKAEVNRGSIFWNEYRKKWILISGAMDIWYAEGDTPVGPWVYAKKVAEHKSFFYNPTQLPFFDQKDGSEVFFDGTFTKFFSKEEVVPRYDYNQILYKLSLEDEQTFLPSSVYLLTDGYHFKETLPKSLVVSDIMEIPFFAMSPDRKIAGLIPIFQNSNKELTVTKESGKPVFYALPPVKHELEPFLGSWEVKINFEAFDNSLIMDIDKENGKPHVSSNKPGFEFSNVSIEKGILSVALNHREGKYNLTATCSSGQLNGNWSKNGSDFEGKWEGSLKSEKKWWGQFSPSVVNLYKYSDAHGAIRYSTDPNLNMTGFIKSEKPLCRVWENPSQNIILDLDTRPTQAPSIY